MEHSPRFEWLVCLLHAVLEFFKHLLPPVGVGLLVIVHRLNECHVEILGRELTLVEQLFVILQVISVKLYFFQNFLRIVALITVFVVVIIVILMDFVGLIFFFLLLLALFLGGFFLRSILLFLQ